MESSFHLLARWPTDGNADGLATMILGEKIIFVHIGAQLDSAMVGGKDDVKVGRHISTLGSLSPICTWSDAFSALHIAEPLESTLY